MIIHHPPAQVRQPHLLARGNVAEAVHLQRALGVEEPRVVLARDVVEHVRHRDEAHAAVRVVREACHNLGDISFDMSSG